MLRLTTLIGCALLLLVTSATVESRPRHSTKKSKGATVVKPAEAVSDTLLVNNAAESPVHSESAPVETTEIAGSTGNVTAPIPQASSSPDKWEFSIAPYFFLAGLDGTVGVSGQRAEVNATFRDLFRNLDFAVMGQFEARKGNWSFLGDVMYMSLSGEKVTPSPFFSDLAVEVKELIVEPSVAYRVVKAERGTVDVLGGVRIWHVNAHLTFQPRILPLVDVEGSKNWADPIVGARGVAKLSPRVFAMGRFDVGGFGVGSDFTGQVFGGVGFQVKPKIALIGGYRYLRADYFNEGFIFKTAMSGIMLGAKFGL